MMSVKYREAGVDIAAGTRAVELMKDAVRSTYGPEVLLGIGAFGGLFDISALKGLAAPVLVASTDGVGTKTKVAAALCRYDTIGHGVSTTVSTTSWCRARGSVLLDYIASSKLDPQMIATVVADAAACRARSALLGGDGEMPGVRGG
jgi:phosphoribosylformylglycinamidine cyclo-ligase